MKIEGEFQKPVIDIEKHIEIRRRRLFPISWELEIGKSYEEKLMQFAKQVEAERKYWEAVAEINVLANRTSLFNYFRSILSEIFSDLQRGEYEIASSKLSSLLQEIERKEQEERALLETKASRSNISAPIISTPSISIPQTTISPPSTTTTTTSTATTTSQATTTTSQPTTTSRITETRTTIYSDSYGRRIVEVRGQYGTYYEAYHPRYGGVSTLSLRDAYNWIGVSYNPFGSAFGGSSLLPTFNPFR